MTLKVDLLPTEKRRIGFDPVIAFLVVLILCSVGIYWLIGQWFDGQITGMDAQIAKVDKEIQEYKDKVPIIEKMKEEVQKYTQEAETIKNLRYDAIKFANILDEVSILVPENVWVTSLNIEPGNKSVTFSGYAAEAQGLTPLKAVADFMRKLRGSKYFVDATLASTTSGTYETYQTFSFTIESHYRDEVAAKAPAVQQKPVPETLKGPETPETPLGPAPAEIPEKPTSPPGLSPAPPVPQGPPPGQAPGNEGKPEGSPGTKGSESK